MAEICQKVEESRVESAPSINTFSWSSPASDTFLAFLLGLTDLFLGFYLISSNDTWSSESRLTLNPR